MKTHHAILLISTFLAAAQISAVEHQVLMKNQGSDGAMVFEPGYLKVNPGDTVKFIAADKTHNTSVVHAPAGASAWRGKMDEEIAVTLEQEGVYLYQCDPHAMLGMVGIIQVGQPVNLEQAKTAAKDLSAKIVMGKERLDKYLSQVKWTTGEQK